MTIPLLTWRSIDKYPDNFLFKDELDSAVRRFKDANSDEIARLFEEIEAVKAPKTKERRLIQLARVINTYLRSMGESFQKLEKGWNRLSKSSQQKIYSDIWERQAGGPRGLWNVKKSLFISTTALPQKRKFDPYNSFNSFSSLRTGSALPALTPNKKTIGVEDFFQYVKSRPEREIAFGDIHTSEGTIVFYVKSIPRLKKSGITHVVMEGINSGNQRFLDRAFKRARRHPLQTLPTPVLDNLNLLGHDPRQSAYRAELILRLLNAGIKVVGAEPRTTVMDKRNFALAQTTNAILNGPNTYRDRPNRVLTIYGASHNNKSGPDSYLGHCDHSVYSIDIVDLNYLGPEEMKIKEYAIEAKKIKNDTVFPAAMVLSPNDKASLYADALIYIMDFPDLL